MVGVRGGQEEHDVLQAVLIADPFDEQLFSPFTRQKPQALLPLVTVPLIDHSLCWLESCQVQEVLIFSCDASSAVKDYIKESYWGSDECNMQVTVTSSDRCLSVGDALREIDRLGLVRSDFIFINGDLVTNINIKPIVDCHKERKKKDKNVLMTLVYKKASLQCIDSGSLVSIAWDKTSQRILHQESLGRAKTKLQLPLSLIQENSTLEVLSTLQDCQVAVCSPHVLPLFADNFDYQTKDDFVHGILVNEEILGNSLYAYLVTGEYGARANSLQAYHAISQDVLSRWAFPHVPDGKSNRYDSEYVYLRHHVYRHVVVSVGRGSVLEENVLIGRGSTVGSNVFIANAVIGKNCRIGNNVRIESCYVWDNVTIQENSTLHTCIVADGAVVKPGVSIGKGCILSYDVIVGPNISLPDGTSLTSKPLTEDDDFGDGEASKTQTIDPSIVGYEGHGYVYDPSTADSDGDSDSPHAYNVSTFWGDDGNLLPSDGEDDKSDIGATTDDESIGNEQIEIPILDDVSGFRSEVQDSLLRGYEEKIKCDNLILEINSSKYANNVTVQDVNQTVTQVLLDLPNVLNGNELKPQELLTQQKEVFKYFLPILKNYMKTASSQKDLLQAVEDYALKMEPFLQGIVHLVHYLYDADVLSEDVIVEWYGNIRNVGPAAKVRAALTRFIQWLQEAEETSEDDDS